MSIPRGGVHALGQGLYTYIGGYFSYHLQCIVWIWVWPDPFLLLSESYPLSVRSKGASLAVACNWFSNFVVGLMTPILKELIKWAMYLFPASSCVMSVVVVMLFYPETKGVELEEIDRVFEEFYATSTMKRVKLKRIT